MDDDGNRSAGDASGGSGPLPKLTIGQRVLAALPNLQREPNPTAPRRSGTTTGAGGGSPGDGAEAVSPDAVLEPGSAAPGTATSGGRLRDSLLGATPPQPRGAPSGMTKEELVVIIKRLDERERVIGLLSAPVGVIVGVVLTIGALHYNPPLHHKGHLTTGTIVYFEGGARVLLSLVVGLAAWSGRRSFVAFALLFLGTAMGFPFALPFWALGVWLIFRVFKWQKELTAITRGASPSRTAATRTAPAQPSTRQALAEARVRGRADARAARASGRRRGAKTPPVPTGPPPSKRYTPPKPTRPRPPTAS